jgi:tubulin gamma
LFERIMKKYSKMRTKGAFLDNYKKEKMFADNLQEFDDSK